MQKALDPLARKKDVTILLNMARELVGKRTANKEERYTQYCDHEDLTK